MFGKLIRVSVFLLLTIALETSFTRFVLAVSHPALEAEQAAEGLLIPPVFVESGYGDALYEGCGGQTAPIINNDFEQEVVELVNQVRASNGLPPLKRNQELDQAARYHAADLAQDDYFDHDSYDRVGQTLTFTCQWSSRVSSYYPGYSSLGENIAGGYSTPEQVMNGWMGSSGHRANILSTSNREIGVGYQTGGYYGSYWVQDFGSRSSVYPLIINNDAATTLSRDVDLYIYGDWDEIRLRNDAGSWTAWQPFSPNLAWTLAGINGNRTVSAEMRRAGGYSSSASDNIQLQSSFVETDTLGVFSPVSGNIFLKSENSTGYADSTITYGIPNDRPIVGDWDGDGVDTIGIYRDGVFYLRNSNSSGYADIVFAFGDSGDLPVAGDWDGDGVDTIGLYRDGMFFLRNHNSSGDPDMTFTLGIPGDNPIAGDWTGQGYDTVGVFRPSNGALYLKNTNRTGFADTVCTYGIPGDKPIVGDWDGNGTDTIGVYRDGAFLLRNSNDTGYADIVFALGVSGDEPIAGKWGELQ